MHEFVKGGRPRPHEFSGVIEGCLRCEEKVIELREDEERHPLERDVIPIRKELNHCVDEEWNVEVVCCEIATFLRTGTNDDGTEGVIDRFTAGGQPFWRDMEM